MPASKRSKREPKCSCGRFKREAARHHYRSFEHDYIFCRCVCGIEWTEDVIVTDIAGPVTAEEVLQVHEFMTKLEGPLSELLEVSE